jgi:REP element-mobilizing transposase RayT
MRPFFTPNEIDPAYATRYHFSWYTHGRQPRIALPATQTALESAFDEVVDAQDYHVLERAIEPHAFRALLSLKPFDSPAEVTRLVKGNLATAARNGPGVSKLWSRGWFVRSVGDVTNETVREYVARQYEHHDAAPICDPDAAIAARYRHSGNAEELRRSAHAAFEFNVHVVFVTHRRHGAAWRDEVPETVWRPGFYVGTVGSATTAQVKAFLSREACAVGGR